MPDYEFTFGTHNLHDESGVPTFFADVVIFTEAIAPTIIAKAKRKSAHAKARLAGYRVIVCHQQPDLVIAFRRRLFKRRGPLSYERKVDGVAHVTPNRGTAWLAVEHRASGALFAVVAEHRINAAFRPFIRGEAAFRQAAWRRHTAYSCSLVTRLSDSGYVALPGGDLNTPRDQAGYPTVRGLQELGEHWDRLAVAPRWAWSIDHLAQLTRKGSDHPRLRVTVRRRRGGA